MKTTLVGQTIHFKNRDGVSRRNNTIVAAWCGKFGKLNVLVVDASGEFESAELPDDNWTLDMKIFSFSEKG